MHKAINFRFIGQFLILLAVLLIAALVVIGFVVIRDLGLLAAVKSFVWDITEFAAFNEGTVTLAPAGLFIVGMLVSSMMISSIALIIRSLIDGGLKLMKYVEPDDDNINTQKFE